VPHLDEPEDKKAHVALRPRRRCTQVPRVSLAANSERCPYPSPLPYESAIALHVRLKPRIAGALVEQEPSGAPRVGSSGSYMPVWPRRPTLRIDCVPRREEVEPMGAGAHSPRPGKTGPVAGASRRSAHAEAGRRPPARGAGWQCRVVRLEHCVYLHLATLHTGRESPDQPSKNHVSFLAASWDLLEAFTLEEVAQDLPLPGLSLDIVSQRTQSLERERVTTERA
jgi:hypothetical protein